MQPDEIQEIVAYVQQHRAPGLPFDVVAAGYLGNKPHEEAAELLRRYAAAGVTWWQEGFFWTDTPDLVRERIRQGPPSFS